MQICQNVQLFLRGQPPSLLLSMISWPQLLMLFLAASGMKVTTDAHKMRSTLSIFRVFSS
jgi:hypothetical protein